MLDDKTVCAQVDAVLEKTGTRRMIMGHTPDFMVRFTSQVWKGISVTDPGVASRNKSPDVAVKSSSSILVSNFFTCGMLRWIMILFAS